MTPCKLLCIWKFLYFVVVLRKADSEYSKKQEKGTATEKSLFKLAWDIKELEYLNSCGRQLRVNISVLTDKLKDPLLNRERENVAGKISKLRQDLRKFVKGITSHQRIAATHCLVIMISPEERSTKPYAIPIQCIPYKGLKDSEVRDIVNKVIKEMWDRDMKVAGW